MRITGIDHIYAETRSWPESIDFWQGLGFTLAEEWGSGGHRAGRLESAAAVLVLAEVTSGEPVLDIFFAAAGLDDGDRPPGVGEPADTHWGTRSARAVDPDGRGYVLEEKP